ncbi:MAG TPA: isochorismate synthase [Candidatus Omnitrophota bacterium]|nr:isochorismate synthase [Candidatus Omnitrophota bacterium]
MITLFRAEQTYKLAELKERMREHIRQLPQKVSFIGTPTKVLRFELACEPVNILSWLHNNQLGLEKTYWSDRANAFEMGAIGSADIISGNDSLDHQSLFEYMQDRLSSDNPHLRFYGGVDFFADKAEGEWQALGSFRFIVPQFEFHQTPQQSVFAFNIRIANVNEEHIREILSTFEKMDFSADTVYRKVPVLLRRADFPDEAQWLKMFNSAHGKFEKIVLARKTVFDFDMDIRPVALLKHLKDMTPNCFHFCFQPHPGYGFLGASPERLFKRTEGAIESEALAGTIGRSIDPDEDAALTQKLLRSAKNNSEHDYVVTDLKNKLSRLCSELRQDPRTQIMKLDNGQHLMTRFEGKLRPKVYDEDILRSLHPTPAVAGCPQEKALKAIAELEPFKRGWYAAPVGYVGCDTTEFVVAIRSGLVNKNQLSLYAGAGIVEGSTAQDEWDEIENKIGSFIKVFKR